MPMPWRLRPGAVAELACAPRCVSRVVTAARSLLVVVAAILEVDVDVDVDVATVVVLVLVALEVVVEGGATLGKMTGFIMLGSTTLAVDVVTVRVCAVVVCVDVVSSPPKNEDNPKSCRGRGGLASRGLGPHPGGTGMSSQPAPPASSLPRPVNV